MTDGPLSAISNHQAMWMIRGAFAAALFSAAVTVWAINTGSVGATAWNFLDVAILLGLAIGTLKRSYTCAWLLLGYYVVNLVAKYFTQGHLPGNSALSLGVLYLLGVIGVVALGPRREEAGAWSSRHRRRGSHDSSRAV